MTSTTSRNKVHAREVAARRLEAKRLRRDKGLFKWFQIHKLASESLHKIQREPVEPLSIYGGKPESPHITKRLTRFPMTRQPNGRAMPAWKDLSAWMKCQMFVHALATFEYQFQTFSVDLHPDLVREWLTEGRDVRAMMRDRLRRELDRRVKPSLEFFFVIEGWSRSAKAPTKLHIHGGAHLYAPQDGQAIVDAARRAAGQGNAGRVATPRASHGRVFHRDGPKYINYLFKSVRRKDERLPSRRLTVSRSLAGTGQSFWALVTGIEYTGL
jgi:hypothetical protein